MSKEVFSFVHPNESIVVGSLSEKDLNEFIRLLNLYHLEYRDSLSLPSDITFGTEIEFIPSKLLECEYFFNFKDWEITYEGSQDIMLEAISPILHDSKEDWANLKEVLKYIKNYASFEAGEDTAAHIHFGSQILKRDKNIKNFFELWCAFEKVIYRFGYAEDLTGREAFIKYATPIGKNLTRKGMHNYSLLALKNFLKDKSNGFSLYNYAGCFLKENNTIEIRSPNGTVEEIIWQNNINFFARLLMYAASSDFDKNEIHKRFKNLEDRIPYLMTFDEIYLEDAIVLCDLIFDKAIDKIYFLRQYLKNFETISQEKSKATCFILK